MASLFRVHYLNWFMKVKMFVFLIFDLTKSTHVPQNGNLPSLVLLLWNAPVLPGWRYTSLTMPFSWNVSLITTGGWRSTSEPHIFHLHILCSRQWLAFSNLAKQLCPESFFSHMSFSALPSLLLFLSLYFLQETFLDPPYMVKYLLGASWLLVFNLCHRKWSYTINWPLIVSLDYVPL